MNILYYSVHQILEDDEIRLFKTLGHNVLCLGANGHAGSVESFRPAIDFNDVEKELYRLFYEMGGKFQYNDLNNTLIPENLIALFDVTIVMHSVEFIKKFWAVLQAKPIVWRTIGQGIDQFESMMQPYRNAGLLIARYSPTETEYPGTLGQDCLIRFCKSSDVYGGWNGEVKQILTFANFFSQRYPDDASDYTEIVAGALSTLGGMANDTMPGAVGLVSWLEQIELYKRSRLYLCVSGLNVPYTLNFVEAWITGIPVVVHAPEDRRGRYFEIDRLIIDGVNGYVCRDIAATRKVANLLLQDPLLAARVGAAGRQSAMQLFGEITTREAWQALFNRVASLPGNLSINTTATTLQARPNLPDVFDFLALLKPYDVDCGKIRRGAERDGGYVVADIPSLSDVISFGVGPDVTFEYEMAENGRRVFMYDHTVEETPQQHEKFFFRKLGVCGGTEASLGLHPLAYHLANINNLTDHLLLKMDVEGAEWDVLSSISQETLKRFDQIVIEIHWLEKLADAAFRTKAIASLTELNKQFSIFHVHANNCVGLHIVNGLTVASVLELSFVRTSLVKRSNSKTVYPASINKSNHPDFPDHPLLFYPFLPTTVDDYKMKEVIRRIQLEASQVGRV